MDGLDKNMGIELKLRAETSEDLTVFSSALQDAILRVGEIRYDSRGRNFTLRLSRFRHEADGKAERVLCGLRFDSVLSVASKGLSREDPEALAVLIAIAFHPADEAPEGEVHLIFAGGGEIRLSVECIDGTLADVDVPKPTKSVPLHPPLHQEGGSDS